MQCLEQQKTFFKAWAFQQAQCHRNNFNVSSLAPTQLLVSFHFMFYSEAILGVSGLADIKTSCFSSQQDNLSQRLCHSPVLRLLSQVFWLFFFSSYLSELLSSALLALPPRALHLWATMRQAFSADIWWSCSADSPPVISFMLHKLETCSAIRAEQLTSAVYQQIMEKKQKHKEQLFQGAKCQQVCCAQAGKVGHGMDNVMF